VAAFDIDIHIRGRLNMTTRALGPGAGIGWLKQAVNLGRNNPKAVFGGAVLLLLAVLLLAIGLTVLVGLLQAALNPGPGGSMALALVVMVPILLLLAALMVGYLRLIDAVENGRAARASDVFSAFRDTVTSVRAIGFVVLLAVVQNVLIFALIGLFAKDVGTWYLQSMQASMSGATPAPMTSLPDGFYIAFVVMLVISLFGYAVQAIGLGQIALRRSSIGSALADGISGAAKNLLPLLVLAVVVAVAGFVLLLAVGLLVMLVGVLAKIAGAWLAVVLGVPLYLAALVAIYVVMFGVMYSVWRDVSGDDAPPRNDAVAA
jgi:hypothetical protein